MPGLASASNTLPDGRFSRHVHYRASIDSTNRLAWELGEAGAPDGSLILAGEQTAGRGRRRRDWVSPPGAGLYVSVLLRPDFIAAESGPAVQLVAGIAVAEALAGILGETPRLRWPNDCYLHDRKIAGVLVEAASMGSGFDFLVCGIGINVNHRSEDFPVELRERATSLALRVGHDVSRLIVLGALLESLDTWEGCWRTHGMESVRQRWLELSPESVGGRISVRTEAGVLDGVADGLSDDGRLLMSVGGTIHEISVGEVVRLEPA